MIDLCAVREALALAAQTIEPDDKVQRQAFKALLPNMYVLRNKGCSFAQLASLLNQCGFSLPPSTVRTYYNEMMVAKMELCSAEMNEQIAILAKMLDVGDVE